MKFINGNDIDDDDPTEWLWPRRIPRGQITIFEGLPGLGKTRLIEDIVARESAMLELPYSNAIGSGGRVLWFTTENDRGKTKRNLRASGGDASKLDVYDVSEGGFWLPDSCPELQRLIDKGGYTVVVIDPLVSFCPTSRESAVRRALDPLALVAAETGCAIIANRHIVKTGSNPIYRGSGSIGVSATVRSCMLIAEEPGMLDQKTRVIAPIKANLGPWPESLMFRVLGDDESTPSELQWVGRSQFQASDLLSRRSGIPQKQLEAAIWLVGQLSNGPVPSTTLISLAAAERFSESTLRRAKEEFGIGNKRTGFGKGSVVFWKLPENSSRIERLLQMERDEQFTSEELEAIPQAVVKDVDQPQQPDVEQPAENQNSEVTDVPEVIEEKPQLGRRFNFADLEGND